MASPGDKRHQLPIEGAVLLRVVLTARRDGEGLLLSKGRFQMVLGGSGKLDQHRSTNLPGKAKPAALEVITASKESHPNYSTAKKNP